MGQSILDKIQAKLELLRLEKRYTRSRHRRSGFVSNAVYVDGEYVYQTPNSTGSSSTSAGGVDALHGGKAVMTPTVASVPAPPQGSDDDAYGSSYGAAPRRKDSESRHWRRFSRFGSSPAAVPPPTQPRHVDVAAQPDEVQRKRMNRYSSMPGFGGTYDSTKTASTVQERRLSMIR